MQPIDQTYPDRKYTLTTGRKVGQSVLAGIFFVGAGFFFKGAINPIGRDLPW
jgi:hypothetical protein